METRITNIVDKLSYQFGIDGDIVLYIDLEKPYSKRHNHLTRIPAYRVKKLPKQLGGDDLIRVDITPSNTDNVFDRKYDIEVMQASKSKRHSLHMDTCPLCKTPLVRSDNTICAGRCPNKTCMAVMTPNVLRFLSAIGITICGVSKFIMDQLLITGCLATISNLFNIGEPELVAQGVTKLDAKRFVYEVHYVRGSVTIGDFLRGIHIYNLKEDDIKTIEKFYNRRKYTLMDIYKLTTGELRNKLNIDWTALDEFNSVEDNKEMLSQLSSMLWYY